MGLKRWGFFLLSFCGVLTAGPSYVCEEPMALMAGPDEPGVFYSARTMVGFSNLPRPGEPFGLRLFQIYDKATGVRIGNISASVRGNKGKILSIGIVNDRRGEELGPEAEALILDFLFSRHKVEKVMVYINEGNSSSIRAHRKLGFTPTSSEPEVNYSVDETAFRNATANRFGDYR